MSATVESKVCFQASHGVITVRVYKALVQTQSVFTRPVCKHRPCLQGLGVNTGRVYKAVL
eukprot:1412743-Alexandrium_andersonii.AAC.1